MENSSRSVTEGNPIAVIRSPLTLLEAINFLNDLDKYQVLLTPPVKLKASQVFLYRAPSVTKEGI